MGNWFPKLMDQNAEFANLVKACEETYTALLAGYQDSESILSEQITKVSHITDETKH